LLRPVRWVGGSRRDLRALPKSVRQKVGFALYFAQHGEKHESAKPLKAFGDAGVLEVVEDYDRGTYRAVYTVRFSEAVYVVLHVFQKKAKRGIATPTRDLELIRARLQEAARLHAAHEGG
jgi:phage-related protein